MTTITIDETLDIDERNFPTLLAFLQEIDIAKILDFKEVDSSLLSPKGKQALQRLEKEGPDFHNI